MSSLSFPGHPKVVALLDKHIGQPLDDPLPDPPVPELLDGLLKGLNNCKKNADRRTESAREAAKVGQETLTRARKRLERQGSIAKARPTLVDEEPKRLKVKDRDLSQRQSTADLESHPRTYPEGKNAGNSARHSTPSTKSPAQLTKVKRELSGRFNCLEGKETPLISHLTAARCVLRFIYSFSRSFGYLASDSCWAGFYWSRSTAKEEETQNHARPGDSIVPRAWQPRCESVL